MATRSRKTLFFLAWSLAVVWSTPARASAPILVRDINPTGSSAPTALKNVGGTLFFQADNGVNGVEAWLSDGTEPGTILVRDILAGSPSSYPRSFAGLGGAIYFSANDGSRGHELWRTDGTDVGTSLVKDLNPGAADSWPGVSTGLIEFGGGLIFEAYTNAAGYELWKTDGTPAGTVLVRDINPGTEGSSPLEIVNVNGAIFFRADNGLPQTNHRELWKSDGTEGGTVMVRDINPSGESVPSGFTELNGMLLFDADDGTNGTELWRSDGTADGTVMVKNINPSGSSYPGQLRNANGTLYFVANDGTNGSELWRSDGTTEGTVMAVDLNPMGGSPISRLMVVNGTRLYFVLWSGSLSDELWTSDGTEAGTVMLREFAPGNYHPMVENLTDVDGTLFFSANDGIHGVELWTSDGTSEGTQLAGDINPGDEWSFSWPQYLRNVGGVLFFAAEDGISGRELWALDPHGTTGISGEVGAPQPWVARLHANVPNPFNLGTTLRFDLAGPTAVTVQIYDASGRRVRGLLASQRMDGGSHAVRWDGRNDRGGDVQSGIYFYRLEAGAAERTGRMVLAQ